ncbi:MAG: hypothetical protein LBP41_00030, partial [Holosporaceae bacterium]|nr:hypothetical protein [Holosporaceae bacterium]
MIDDCEKIRRLIEQQEGSQLEFKEARDTLPRRTYETVCSFIHRYCELYSGSTPIIKDEDIFKFELSINFYDDKSISSDQ